MHVQPGMLLVATPELGDPNFAGSVVLLLDADDDGVLGVILTRPTRTSIEEILPDWSELSSPPSVLFEGGPVGTDGALAVSRLRDHDAAPIGWRPITSHLGILDLDTPPDLIGDALTGLRIFIGYAGWDAEQLRAEIATGSWYVVEGRLDDVFAADAPGLRNRVLRRQPGALAWHVTRPVNPKLN